MDDSVSARSPDERAKLRWPGLENLVGYSMGGAALGSVIGLVATSATRASAPLVGSAIGAALLVIGAVLIATLSQGLSRRK